MRLRPVIEAWLSYRPHREFEARRVELALEPAALGAGVQFKEGGDMMDYVPMAGLALTAGLWLFADQRWAGWVVWGCFGATLAQAFGS